MVLGRFRRVRKNVGNFIIDEAIAGWDGFLRRLRLPHVGASEVFIYPDGSAQMEIRDDTGRTPAGGAQRRGATGAGLQNRAAMH